MSLNYKKKILLSFGYIGKDYSGLQINKNVITIENKIYDSLVNNNMINERNLDNLKKINWKRCSRTDKGVSAACNLLSFKIQLNNNYILKNDIKYKIPSIINENINKELIINDLQNNLPENIIIHNIQFVSKRYNPQKDALYRNYEYIIPLKIFNNKDISNIDIILKKFIGTKNYHNYTIKKKFNDKSCHRYIKNIETCFYEYKKSKFIIIKIKGQSFMIHQIRKMIYMVINVIINDINIDYLDETFNEKKININLAPSFGLLLNYPELFSNELYFNKELYNKIDNFKSKILYKNIFEEEINDNIFNGWLEKINNSEFY